MKSRALNDIRLARLRLKVDVPDSLPAVLVEAIAACTLIVEDRGRFPELGSGRGQERFKFSESGRERDLRRLEGIALVGMSLLLHCDLVRLRSGKVRSDGSCDSIRVARPRQRRGRLVVDRGTYSTIETETGLKRTALFEALRDGASAGYWESHQPRKRWEDELTGEERWRGFPAVYTISKLFFQRLGIDLEWLEEQRRKASERERQREPAPIVDVHAARQRQLAIRQQARAARRAVVRSIHPGEAEGRAAIRRLQERITRRRQE